MKMINYSCACLAIVFASCLASAAQSYDWSISARVTSIEVTYMPGSIDFSVDRPGGVCGAGALLSWLPAHHQSDPEQQNQNAMAILSILTTAKSSGQTVTLYGSNSGCEINYLYLQ